MNIPRKNIFKVTVIVAIAFLCALVYDQWNNRRRNVTPPVSEIPYKPESHTSVEETVTVTELLDAFKQDREGSIKKYKGKVISIRGLIGEIVKDGLTEAERNAQRWYKSEDSLDKYVLLVLCN